MRKITQFGHGILFSISNVPRHVHSFNISLQPKRSYEFNE